MLTAWPGRSTALTCSQASSSSSSHSLLAAPHPCAAARVGSVHAGWRSSLARPANAAPVSRTLNSRVTRPLAAAAAHSSATTAPTGLRVLYPQLAAHASGYLKVSDLHTLYYEVYGNPRGIPAVVVHGGPGAGCWPNHARLFDPAHYRIILVDQRGCGRSTPYGCLAGNTTADLVSDLEQLRKALGVHQWLMLGGSWGVTLTLAYAQAHPTAVLGIILRGVCLMRPQEINWMFGGGAAALKPLGWQQFLKPLSAQERSNPLMAYYNRLLSPDAKIRSEAAKSWSAWEMSVGFSTGQTVGVWDGQSWSEQPTPAVPQQLQQQPPARQQQKQQLQPPPKPMGVEACAAACAALSDSMKLLSLTLHNRDLSGSSWFSTLQQQQQQPCTTNTAAYVSAGPQQHSANKASLDNLQRPYRRNGGAAAASGSSHSNCTPSQQAAVEQTQQQQQQQSAVSADLQLIERGLQHRGFKEHSSAQALLEAHYSVHAAFLQQQPLLDEVGRIRNIPCIAVQGQWDLVCPPTTAVELGQVWPEMELRLVPRAGHSMYDPAITHELVTATDRMRVLEPWCPAPAARSDVAAASLAGVC